MSSDKSEVLNSFGRYETQCFIVNRARIEGPRCGVKELFLIHFHDTRHARLNFVIQGQPGLLRSHAEAKSVDEVAFLLDLILEPIAKLSHAWKKHLGFIAQQASLASGIDAEDIKRLYKAGASTRSAARDFDFDKAGEELAGNFDRLKSNLKSAAGKRTGELNDAARNSYMMRESDPTEAMDALRALAKKGREHSGTVGNLSYIEAANDILENGSSSIPGLSKSPWHKISDVEMYDRLQAAREYLGDNIKFSTQQGLSKAAKESQNAYHAIGKVLKFDPDKMEADSVWSAYKRLEDNLLDQLDVNGKVDKYKIGNSLKDTQTAKRFRDNLAMLDEFVARPGLPDDIKRQVASFREGYAKFLDTADLKRAIQKFERDVRGVSGQAVERAGSLSRGDDVLAERIKAPAQGLLSSEQLIKAGELFFGKPFAQMSQAERRVIINYQTAVKKNPNMTFPEAVKLWGAKP